MSCFLSCELEILHLLYAYYFKKSTELEIIIELNGPYFIFTDLKKIMHIRTRCLCRRTQKHQRHCHSESPCPAHDGLAGLVDRTCLLAPRNKEDVFEVELIKQIEINIDYVLMLVKKYHDTHCEDKEVLITIRKAVDASPELRSKKALIETFINGINDVDDIINEWLDYVVNMREQELVIIIEQEHLKSDATRRFLDNAFRDGEIKTIGTDIDKLLPPVSRFGSGNRANKKKIVVDRLKAYFEKLYGIGGNTGFVGGVKSDGFKKI